MPKLFKTECNVCKLKRVTCGDVCEACKLFFKKSELDHKLGKELKKCPNNDNCVQTTPEKHNLCSSCRYQRCLSIL